MFSLEVSSEVLSGDVSPESSRLSMLLVASSWEYWEETAVGLRPSDSAEVLEELGTFRCVLADGCWFPLCGCRLRC